MNNFRNKILYVSRFLRNENGNGGDRRTAQICKALNSKSFEFVTLHGKETAYPKGVQRQLAKKSSFITAPLDRLQCNRLTYGKYFMWDAKIQDYILFLHAASVDLCKILRTDPPMVLCIDDPIFLAPLASFATEMNIPLVSICHNLESLSREQVNPSQQRCLFDYELNLLSQSHLVITISREETFLLKNLDINAHYFPYYPVSESRMSKIRAARATSNKNGFLLLGTVLNMPTMVGMKKVIAEYTTNCLDLDTLSIAGFGTDRLDVNHRSVSLLGELSDYALDDTLSRTKCCIVYQETGAGALTKIPELLLSGVPIVINAHAARSYHKIPGLVEFDSLNQIHQCLIAAESVDVPLDIISPPNSSVLAAKIEMLYN